jgi:hypothetical protein
MHKNAISSYSTKIDEIFCNIKKKELPKIDKKNVGKKVDSGQYISRSIDNSEILGYKISLVDGSNCEVGFSFFYDKCKFTIDDLLYEDLMKVIRKISEEKDYNQKVSSVYILELFKEWVEKKIKCNEMMPFIDYLTTKCKNEIKDYEVLVPIDQLSSEIDFVVGEVTIKTISLELINTWFSSSLGDNPNSHGYYQKFRKDHQGFIAASYQVTAEKNKAREVAFKKINDAFMILRIFSRSNLVAQLRSYIDFDSWKLVDISHTIIVNIDNDKICSNEEKVQSNGKVDILRANISKYLHDSSLSGFNEIIMIKNKNEFQQKLYDALYIYSKHTLQKEIYDKLLYVLVSIESLLLRNENEPITQNISERIAFTIGKKSIDRKIIVRSVKDIYAIRSKYIHHGIFPQDKFEEVNRFLNMAWLFYTGLTQNINKFKTKDEFLNYLDEIKYS